jgi:RHS repeat-associated protein
MHRSLGKSYSDGTSAASYAYDASTELGASLVNTKGRMAYGAAGNSASAFSYDVMGRTANVWSCTPYNCGTSTYQLGFGFDYAGDITSFTDSNTFANRSTSITYTYSFDQDSRLTGMSSNYTGTNYPATLFTVNTINALGAATKATLGNGIVRTSTYDSRKRIDSLADKNGSTTTYSYSLGYFANNAINTSTDSLEGTWTYGYDGFNRLSTASETGQAFAYQYDQFGNRWGTNSGCSSSNTSACQFTFNASNRITNGGITYDAAGNVLNDGIYSYTFDAEGRITNVKQGSTQVASYTYDAFGKRTHEVTGSTTYEFVFDTAGRPYEQIVGTNRKHAELYAGSTHVGEYANSTTYFSSMNQVGTEIRHTIPVGSNASTCTNYLPFGDGASCTGAIQTLDQPQFTGQWQDLETGLNHMSARNYSPVEARWTTPDPSGVAASDPSNPQSWNQYAYALNNPVSNVDPSGLASGQCDTPGDCDSTWWDETSGGEPVNPNALNGWDMLAGDTSCGLWCHIKNYFNSDCPWNSCVNVTATIDPVPTTPSTPPTNPIPNNPIKIVPQTFQTGNLVCTGKGCIQVGPPSCSDLQKSAADMAAFTLFFRGMAVIAPPTAPAAVPASFVSGTAGVIDGLSRAHGNCTQ